jgi:hypothetical protein
MIRQKGLKGVDKLGRTVPHRPTFGSTSISPFAFFALPVLISRSARLGGRAAKPEGAPMRLTCGERNFECYRPVL